MSTRNPPWVGPTPPNQPVPTNAPAAMPVAPVYPGYPTATPVAPVAQPVYPTAPVVARPVPVAPVPVAPVPVAPVAYGVPGMPAMPTPVMPAPAMPMPVMPTPVMPTPVVPGPSAYSPHPAYPVQPVPVVQPVPQPVVQPVAPVVQPVVAARPVPVTARPVAPTPVSLAPKPVSVAPNPAAAVAAAAVAPAAVSMAPTPTVARPVPVTPGAARPVPATPVSARPIVVQSPNAPVVAESEEEEETVEEKIIEGSPPWLVSLIVHAVLLVVAALIAVTLPDNNQHIMEVIMGEDIGVQLVDDTLTTGLMEEVDVADPALSMDTMPAEDPFAAPPDVPVFLDGPNASDNIEAPSIGMALSGREKGMKSALLGKYGGNTTTEAAVRAGLEWLKRNQEASGSWSLTGPYSNGSGIENRCAATAMALLAFQGAGNTHKEGDFKKEVAKGWSALLKMQDRDGVFYHEGVHHQQLYAQAQATIAICELYGMTKDKEYREPAQRAVNYAIKIQSPEGGWRYTPGSDSDTSVTGWFVMALQSALMAGLEVPSPSLEKISSFLDSVAAGDGSQYSYRPGVGPTETMTAEGLLCRQYLSWKHDDPRLRRGIETVLANPIRWDFDNTNVYYWYYATQVTHHMEGDAWKEWNGVMREVIPKNQLKTGKEAGSWPPEMDRWGAHGGRLYETCLCIYMLEVYYRHLPIYKWRQQ